MAKYDEGDIIRIKRPIKVGGHYLKANSKGKIKKIEKKTFGKSKYTIFYSSLGFAITHNGESDFEPLSEGSDY